MCEKKYPAAVLRRCVDGARPRNRTWPSGFVAPRSLQQPRRADNGNKTIFSARPWNRTTPSGFGARRSLRQPRRAMRQCPPQESNLALRVRTPTVSPTASVDGHADGCCPRPSGFAGHSPHWQTACWLARWALLPRPAAYRAAALLTELLAITRSVTERRWSQRGSNPHYRAANAASSRLDDDPGNTDSGTRGIRTPITAQPAQRPPVGR